MNNFDEHWALHGNSFTERERKVAQAFYFFGMVDATRQVLDVLESVPLISQPLVDELNKRV
jgi:hypothetical protein